MCQSLEIKRCSEEDDTEEGKPDIYPQNYNIKQTDSQAKIKFQTKFCEEERRNRLIPNYNFWTNLSWMWKNG